MGSITKVQSAKGIRWRAQVRRKNHPALSSNFERKSDAQRWIREQEAKIDRGKAVYDGASRKRTLNELIDRYRTEILPAKKSWRVQDQQLTRWAELIGTLPILEITPDIVLRTRTRIAEQKNRYGQPISNATLNRYTAVLDHVFQVAIRQYRWAENNPVRIINKLKEPQGRTRSLSAEELPRLLEACRKSKSPFLETIVLIALTTGMRHSEIMQLTWDKVFLDQGLVIIEEPKNGQRRSAHLQPQVIDRLEVLKQERDADVAWVFPGKSGLTPLDTKSAWQTARKQAGLIDFRFHDLRHTTATMIALQGASVPQIAAVLGHKSHQMASRYAHLTSSDSPEILNKAMSRVFDDGEKT